MITLTSYTNVMKIFLLSYVLLLLSCTASNKDQTPSSDLDMNKHSKKQVAYAMVIHGGAGTILKKNMTAEKEAAYRSTLDAALTLGEDILKSGGTSQAAVIATIKSMENSPLFNAGKGAVFTHAGTNEMDASIMDGNTLNAGAVGGVTTIKNPITAAVAVMEKSDHVFMVGKGAENFAASQACELADPAYFKTESRMKSLEKAKAREKDMGVNFTELSENKYGTVGAVALDKSGNIVAGTSTGGMTNKRYNRIGDSPVIGAGTYADNATCGVSCTGHGEYFIRYAVAYDVSAMMAYANESVTDAADKIINEKLKKAGGSGGLIALDKQGNIAMPFNTPGMYRGYVTDTERVVKIYKDN